MQSSAKSLVLKFWRHPGGYTVCRPPAGRGRARSSGCSSSAQLRRCVRFGCRRGGHLSSPRRLVLLAGSFPLLPSLYFFFLHCSRFGGAGCVEILAVFAVCPRSVMPVCPAASGHWTRSASARGVIAVDSAIWGRILLPILTAPLLYSLFFGHVWACFLVISEFECMCTPPSCGAPPPTSPPPPVASTADCCCISCLPPLPP